ncbi:MAG: hypothetical protein F4Z07_13470 [Dehalococcoidia bacterium]|nr:hypothetical protein [Dehalococcoidia bacterium]
MRAVDRAGIDSARRALAATRRPQQPPPADSADVERWSGLLDRHALRQPPPPAPPPADGAAETPAAAETPRLAAARAALADVERRVGVSPAREG